MYVFKQSAFDMNSEIFFSYIGCLNKVKQSRIHFLKHKIACVCMGSGKMKN